MIKHIVIVVIFLLIALFIYYGLDTFNIYINNLTNYEKNKIKK